MNQPSIPFGARYPTLGTDPLPVGVYADEARYAAERVAVFGQAWLCVGREDEVPEAGDWFVRDLAVGEASVLVVRDAQGQVHAFHNVCRHRLNRVAVGERGNCAHFVCSFHGWVYDHHGRLVSVPDEAAFHGLDRARMGLKSLPTGVWEGFVFVHLREQPRLTLREFMGELAEQYAGYPMDRMTRLCSIEATLECNWKVVLDAFQEAYHVLELHRRSAPGAFNGSDNPLGHLNDVRLYERHRAISVYGNPEQSPSRAAALALRLAHTGTYTPALGELHETLPPGINPQRRTDWAFDVALIYPNVSWYQAHGWALVQYYWPLGPTRTRYEQHFYTHAPTTVSGRIGLEHTKAMLYDVALEDLSTVERVQSVVAGGAVNEMWLSDQEIAIRHSHAVIERAIAGIRP